MQQTAYAAARSKDPRNQIFGVGVPSGYVDPRAVNPFINRPSGYPAADMSMYQQPPSQNWRNTELSNANPQAPAPAGLEQLAQQAQQDNQAITQQPGFADRLQALMDSRQQGQPNAPLQSNGNLAGIEVPMPGEPNQASVESLGTEEGMEAAGLSPRLPTTPPKPLEKDDKTFTADQVNASQTVVGNILKSQAPAEGVSGATMQADHSRLQSDLQKVAESKNPEQAWNKLQKQPFYQNSSFYTGLMGVGLSIMSGKSPIEAFQIGQGMSQQDDIKKQLEANRDNLIDQGYSQDSVAAAIASGDPSQLKMRQRSIEEQRQDALAAEDRSNAEWERRNQITSAQADARQAAADERAQRNAALVEQRQKNLIDYRNQAKAQMAAEAAKSFNFTSKDLNAEKNTPEGKNNLQWSQKYEFFNASLKDLEQARDAVASGDPQKARAAYMQTLFNAVKGEIGDNRSIQIEDLKHFGADPAWLVRQGNEWSMKAGFAPTQKNLDYLDKAIDVGRRTAELNTRRLKEQRIKSLAKFQGKERATALVNSAYGGVFTDPYSVFGDDEDTQSYGSGRAGALSSDWMMSQQSN